MSEATEITFADASAHARRRMRQAPAISEAELLGRVRAVAPFVAEHARQAEQARKPVDAVMDALEDTGLYHWFVPKAYGGYEFSLDGFMEIGLILGEACVSTAWVTTFCMEHNWLLALYGKEAQDDLFGAQPYIIAPGALSPNGHAVPVAGGYKLSGRWQWGTGVMHADWVMLGAVTQNEDGKPMLVMALAPRDEVQVLDTWNTAGMLGTGSNDIVATDVFVPAHRAQNLAWFADGTSPGSKLHDSPIYAMPMLPVLGLTAAAPLVGGARQAVALFEERLKERFVYGTGTKQGERAAAHIRVGELNDRVENLAATLKATAAEVTAWGERREACPVPERARLRTRIAGIGEEARRIAQDVVAAGGASAQFLDNPLQRILRDLQTASCHTVFDRELVAEQYGRLRLGLEPNAPI
ncbi:MAG: acyl-CoA dehydrogenase family protein [Pseudomonadota bacterium]